MAKVWRIIISIVLAAVLLAAVCGGVAMLTGASITRIYSTLNTTFNIEGYIKGYTTWFKEEIIPWAQSEFGRLTLTGIMKY